MTAVRVRLLHGRGCCRRGRLATPGALTLPASETSWATSLPYRTRVTGYDNRDHPTSTAIDIPGTSSVSRTYNYSYTYNDAGTVTSTTMPAIGSILPAETVTTSSMTSAAPSTSEGPTPTSPEPTSTTSAT